MAPPAASALRISSSHFGAVSAGQGHHHFRTFRGIANRLVGTALEKKFLHEQHDEVFRQRSCKWHFVSELRVEFEAESGKECDRLVQVFNRKIHIDLSGP